MLPYSVSYQHAPPSPCTIARILPKDSSKGLEFDTMIPPKINGYDSVCHGQVEALAATFESSDHDPEY